LAPAVALAAEPEIGAGVAAQRALAAAMADAAAAAACSFERMTCRQRVHTIFI